MVNLFAWFSRGKCQFVNSSQATVLRRYFIARRFAVPKCQQIQARKGQILTTPRYINADDINFSLGHFGETRDHVNKVFESANITRVGIVHPTVDVDKKERPLCLANQVNGSGSL